MHQRKRLMAQLGDATIALPGGCGTLEELLEVITWKQLGLYLKPVVLLNVNGYYDPPAGNVPPGGGRTLHAPRNMPASGTWHPPPPKPCGW